MDAVISDIHGNVEALDAVLHAIRSLGAARIICLGDLVCYGPDSIECVRRSADVMATVDKIRRIPEIDNMHAERLLVGR